jgi:hypothetical protein
MAAFGLPATVLGAATVMVRCGASTLVLLTPCGAGTQQGDGHVRAQPGGDGDRDPGRPRARSRLVATTERRERDPRSDSRDSRQYRLGRTLMSAGRRQTTMQGMSTPNVVESPLNLEPVTADSFVADLDRPPSESVLRLLASATPRRRIFD